MKISVETSISTPTDKVRRAYTTPDDIKQWSTASDDWPTTASTVDLRVGGAFSSLSVSRRNLTFVNLCILEELVSWENKVLVR